MNQTLQKKKNIPFFIDHAVKLSPNTIIESNSMGGDCVTVDPTPNGCDDD